MHERITICMRVIVLKTTQTQVTGKAKERDTTKKERLCIKTLRCRNTELPPAHRELFGYHLHMVGKSMRNKFFCTEVAQTMRESLIR